MRGRVTKYNFDKLETQIENIVFNLYDYAGSVATNYGWDSNVVQPVGVVRKLAALQRAAAELQDRMLIVLSAVEDRTIIGATLVKETKADPASADFRAAGQDEDDEE